MLKGLRCGHIDYTEVFSGAYGPGAYIFGINGKVEVSALRYTGQHTILRSTRFEPWPVLLEAMAVQLYTSAGLPMMGYWFELAFMINDQTYLPLERGYTDDFGTLHWNGQVHSPQAIALISGFNDWTAATLRFQASYVEEVKGQ